MGETALGVGIAGAGCAGVATCVPLAVVGGIVTLDGLGNTAKGVTDLTNKHDYKEGQGVENSFSANTHGRRQSQPNR